MQFKKELQLQILDHQDGLPLVATRQYRFLLFASSTCKPMQSWLISIDRHYVLLNRESRSTACSTFCLLSLGILSPEVQRDQPFLHLRAYLAVSFALKPFLGRETL